MNGYDILQIISRLCTQNKNSSDDKYLQNLANILSNIYSLYSGVKEKIR